MKKKTLSIIATTLFSMVLVSCGSSTWSWDDAKADGELNYVLLIGQIDHNDSAARTAGIRDALGTRAANATANANTEDPVPGTLTLSGVEYDTIELEHAEQKAQGGATWDQATATSTAEAWINKHGSDIDFFVSNNDGMAEGAIGASNWIAGTPIFGYDANASTLELIDEGKIMGTVDQNVPAQIGGLYMLARNAIDGATPAEAVTEGFSVNNPNGYGKLTSEVAWNSSHKSLLVSNVAITKENVNQHLGKTTAEKLEATITQGTTDEVDVWLDIYSQSDTFLNTNVKPFMEQYAVQFNFNMTFTAGDGSDESSVTDLLDAELAKTLAERPAAYLINMVRTNAAEIYLNMIATAYGATTADPTDVPVIFYNRQATTDEGAVDVEVMADERFTHVYYFGFDAIQGGQLQGEMIVDYLESLEA